MCKLVLYVIVFTFVTNCAMSSNDISPTESPVISSIRMKRSEQVLLDKIKTCVRNELNTLDGSVINCSYKKMYRVFLEDTRTNCKNCNPYFYCLANLVAIRDCGDSDKTRQVTEAVSGCSVLRAIDDRTGLVMEASTYGRSQGDCDAMYLCSHGCRYAASNSSCTRLCR